MVEDSQKPSFYNATFPRLSGSPLVPLPYLRYEMFNRNLNKYKDAIDSNKDPVERLDIFLEALYAAGHDLVEDPHEAVVGFKLLLIANTPYPRLPWQIPPKEVPSEEQKEKKRLAHEDIEFVDNLNYEGSDVARIVSALSSRYHWTADYILGTLTAYEVAIWMQEALVEEDDQKNWQYMLADVGFKKEGDKLVKQDLPKPFWRIGKPVRKTAARPIPAKMRPTGYIIDYTKDPKGQAYEVPLEEGQTDPNSVAKAKVSSMFNNSQVT